MFPLLPCHNVFAVSLCLSVLPVIVMLISSLCCPAAAVLMSMIAVVSLSFPCFQRAQTESVTFLGSHENSRSLYAIPGLDYVAHDDVMPYSTTERTPLFHELFDKFLEYEPDKGGFLGLVRGTA